MREFELLLKVSGTGDTESPFESALRRVAGSGSLDLACPYLSVELLREFVAVAPRFRLVTDAEEWLRAFARPARRDILAFMSEHPTAVRHYRDLHAKVALSPALAMFGSANFTERGMFERQEVGALVDDPTQVAALQDWFDALWQHATPIDVDQLADYADMLPITAQTEHAALVRLLPPPTTDAVSTVVVEEDDTEWATDSEERLVHYLAKAPSRSWADQFLEAARVLSRYLTEWLVACQGERFKATRSSNAASHSRTLFRAATDRAYRQRLFARVDWASA